MPNPRPKLSRALKDARRMAAAVPGLAVRQSADGTLHWRWVAAPGLRKAGWKGQQLGMEEAEAVKRARAINADVSAWRNGTSAAAGPALSGRRITVAGLIEVFRRKYMARVRPGTDQPLLQRTTIKTYNTALNRIELALGPVPAIDLQDVHVWDFRDAMVQSGLSADSVHGTLRVARTMFHFAEKHRMIPKGSNPATDFDMAQPDPRLVLMDDDVRALLTAKADAMGLPGMGDALTLGFCIGQREADMLALTATRWCVIPAHKAKSPADWAYLASLSPDGTVRGIRLRQRKTSAWVEIPVVGDDRLRMESAMGRAQQWHCLTILTDDHNQRPWDGENGQRRFQRRFAMIRAAAADDAAQAGNAALATRIASVQFGDLRRSCVVHLAELGLDEHQIASITGHDLDQTRRILRHYLPHTTGRAISTIATAHARAAAAKEGV